MSRFRTLLAGLVTFTFVITQLPASPLQLGTFVESGNAASFFHTNPPEVPCSPAPGVTVPAGTPIEDINQVKYMIQTNQIVFEFFWAGKAHPTTRYINVWNRSACHITADFYAQFYKVFYPAGHPQRYSGQQLAFQDGHDGIPAGYGLQFAYNGPACALQIDLALGAPSAHISGIIESEPGQPYAGIPVCQTATPPPAPTPPAPSGACTAAEIRSLIVPAGTQNTQGKIVMNFQPNSGFVRFHNFSNCTFNYRVLSQRRGPGNQPGQVHAQSQVETSAPGSTSEAVTPMPGCMAQVDVYQVRSAADVGPTQDNVITGAFTEGIPFCADIRNTVDLAVSKSGPSAVTPNGTVTYEIAATTHGPAHGYDAVITDPIPSGLSFVSSTDNRCGQEGNNVVCRYPWNYFAPGTTGRFNLTFRVNANAACGSQITNTVSVTSPGTIDPNNGNNQSQTTATVTGCAASSSSMMSSSVASSVASSASSAAVGADLRAGNSLTPTATKGQTAFYGFTVTNQGPQTAQTVTLTAPIPSGFVFAPGNSDPECVQAGSTIVCTSGPLNVNFTEPFVMGFSTNNATCGTTVTTQGTVTSVTPDPDLSNNQTPVLSTLILCSSSSSSVASSTPVPQCRDGIDNDNDGATDHPNDFSCSGPDDNDETFPKAQCQDGIDNDGDGLIDFGQDPGCSSFQDNDEFNAGLSSSSSAGASSSAVSSSAASSSAGASSSSAGFSSSLSSAVPQCRDGIDNDNDGATDHPNDFSCSGPDDNDETFPKAQCQDGIDNDGDNLVDFPQDPGCVSFQDNDELNAGSSSSFASSLQSSSAVSSAVPQCRDGIDNDNDGATDHPNDFSCSGPDDNDETFPKAQCQDGIDNDGDGLIDFGQDPGCSSRQDNDEFNAASSSSSVSSAVPQCRDGIDNDGDGATDMNDFSCSNPDDNDETFPRAQCQDGIDNDGDNLVDFPNDPGCANRQDNDEFNQSGGGSSSAPFNPFVFNPILQNQNQNAVTVNTPVNVQTNIPVNVTNNNNVTSNSDSASNANANAASNAQANPFAQAGLTAGLTSTDTYRGVSGGSHGQGYKAPSYQAPGGYYGGGHKNDVQYVGYMPQTGEASAFTAALAASSGLTAAAPSASSIVWIALGMMGLSAGGSLGRRFLL